MPRRAMTLSVLAMLAMLAAAVSCDAAFGAATTTRPRARDLGVPFDGTPGPLNAITDVAGVLVGHTTLIEGNGKLIVGKGPVRTGVTAVLPRAPAVMLDHFAFAGWYAQNGSGEMTGTAWVEE
ncbi:MAG TPA: P1 family peptidase, partial [Steroidobacteraceae bacterium]|nr:P1 family peptidase [Steroidobacteraceae bacterium]